MHVFIYAVNSGIVAVFWTSYNNEEEKKWLPVLNRDYYGLPARDVDRKLKKHIYFIQIVLFSKIKYTKSKKIWTQLRVHKYNWYVINKCEPWRFSKYTLVSVEMEQELRLIEIKFMSQFYGNAHVPEWLLTCVIMFDWHV